MEDGARSAQRLKPKPREALCASPFRPVWLLTLSSWGGEMEGGVDVRDRAGNKLKAVRNNWKGQLKGAQEVRGMHPRNSALQGTGATAVASGSKVRSLPWLPSAADQGPWSHQEDSCGRGLSGNKVYVKLALLTNLLKGHLEQAPPLPSR